MPNRLTNPWSEGRTGAQYDRSPVRKWSRWKLIPHDWTSAWPNRSWDSGIRNSAVHPPSSREVATSQTASHDPSPLTSSNRIRSAWTPAGLTLNMKPVRSSAYESIMTQAQSVSR